MAHRPIVRLLLAAAMASSATTARAGDVSVTITDAAGRPVKDAVITVDVPGAATPARGRFRVDQKDTTFMPFVLVVPAGSQVDFANLDPFRHHVYSFSPAKTFELKLFGQGETRSVTLDKPGVVALGCNIHDSMQAFIQVVSTPYAARSGANGKALLRGVPGGTRELRVWHPYLRAPANQMKIRIDTTRDIAVPVKVKLRKPAPMLHDY